MLTDVVPAKDALRDPSELIHIFTGKDTSNAKYHIIQIVEDRCLREANILSRERFLTLIRSDCQEKYLLLDH